MKEQDSKQLKKKRKENLKWLKGQIFNWQIRCIMKLVFSDKII